MTKRASFLAIILIFVLVGVALAQDGNSQPTQQDLSAAIMALMATVAALLGSAVVDWIKGLSFLRDEDKSKLSGPAAQLVSVVVNIGAGYMVAVAGQGLGLIGDAGLQTLVISMAAPAVAELRYRVAKLATQDPLPNPPPTRGRG